MAKLKALTCAALLLAISAASGRAAPSKADIQDAPFVERSTLEALYSGKSWIWKDGAAYFRSDGRFLAWSGEGRKATYATGGWEIYRWGNICLLAKWYTRSGAAVKTICFTHRELDGTIFQRKDPKGKWYAFKHSPERNSDEFHNLRNGDIVTYKMAETRKFVQMPRVKRRRGKRR